MEKFRKDCQLFDGYKPCYYKRENCLGCNHYTPKGKMILLINLDALGDVLMTTASLKPIKREYPQSTIYWVTDRSAVPLLENNPLIYRVMPFGFESFLILKSMRFDLVLNADKSLKSAAFAGEMDSGIKKGFSMNSYGVVIPFDKEAQYNYEMGLNDALKFKQNRLTGQKILADTFGLDYKRDEYILELDESQKRFVNNLKKRYKIKGNDVVIGFNTGCSPLYPHKKIKKENIIKIIRRLHKDHPEIKIALFGGKNETFINKTIVSSLKFNVINTPTEEGLKTGMAAMDIADIIVTADTLGMHIGIALKKEMVVWYNVSCAAEIDLYGRGEKIISKVDCSPCWKPDCDSLVCHETIDLEELYHAIKREIKKVKRDKNPDHPA
ncbi:MAG: glycosyltransferase family 9 protein [Spirochaetes bacterium]|nr:glycosyltransferase family 9 protein [Spirochaetota bacterium]